jgi:membrane dipeptidase
VLAAEPAIQWARRIQYFGSVGKWVLQSPIRVQGLLLCCLLWAATARAEDGGVEPRAAAEAKSVHRQSVIVDLHADTPFQLVHRGGYSLRRRNSFLQIDAPRLRAGNVGAQFFALWPPPPAVRSGRARAFCERALAAIRKAAADSGALEMVASVEGIHAARRKGRIAGLLGMEGAECLDGRAEDLDRWHAEGVRYLGLTWNFVNPFATPASGARPEDRSRGLTPLGRELVRRAHGLGVLIDVSHANQATFWDVVRTAPGPFIASHSNAFSVRSHPRNLDDEQVRAIARAKGVVGVNFHRPFLARGRAALADVVKHVLHLVRVAGAEHVALGADYDGNIQVPRGLEDPSTWPNLTRALLDAGLPARDVRRVLGENVLRVLNAAKSTSPLERVVPLAVRDVRPRAARRLFDRNERTRYANRRAKNSVRFRFDGEPSRLAFTPCGKHASFRVSLAAARTGTRESMRVRLVEGRVTVRASPKAPAQAVFRRGRVVLELPPLARSRFEVALGGVRCLREVTVYERVTPSERAP